jgi:Zn finger protein HypA/HybF involved in hydrogenase expression
MKIEMSKLQCKRCSHEWYPKQPEVRLCPKCKSPYWDRERRKRD